MVTIPTHDDVLAAAELIRPRVHRKLIFLSTGLSRLTGAALHSEEVAAYVVGAH